jgi:NAD(P)-dependent dehydrogenase (short-subunit alcohol dehydrogenase family)
LIDETLKTFKQINSLVNNAAISNPFLSGKLEDVSLSEWNKFMTINLNSVFLCSKYSIPHLKKQKNSSIINISSTRALMSEKNSEGYAATKGGIVSLTHSMAISLGEEIKVNCISPGLTLVNIKILQKQWNSV